METCTNCGQTLRPGAKFCTTCGTRLNETTPNLGGWGNQPEDTSQQTTVLEAVNPPDDKDESSKPGEPRQHSADAWTSAYSGDSTSTRPSAASDDPASRFISALDEDVKPVAEDRDDADSKSDPASTWETPAPSFTPPPPSNWSYSGNEESEPTTEPETKSTDTEPDSTWETPTTWAAVTSTPDAPIDEPDDENVDSAGFSDGGAEEVDYLSGDENIAQSGAASPELPPDEARDKAIALADELRRTIRMMSSDGKADHGAAAMALTEASLQTGDFSDIRGIVAEVKDNPRDIRTLGELAEKIDRIEALLDDHASLVDTIETAIKELDGN